MSCSPALLDSAHTRACSLPPLPTTSILINPRFSHSTTATRGKIRPMISQYPSPPPRHTRLSRILRLAGVGAATLAGVAIAAFATVPAAQAQEDFYWYPVLKPSYFYNPAAGFGVGIGLNGRNLFRDGDAARSRNRALQYRQSASLGWASSKPVPGWTGWLVSTNFVRNLREEFYGEGPGSLPTSAQTIHRQHALAELRRSQRVSGSFWIQARVGVRIDHLLNYRPSDPENVAPPELIAELQTRESEGTRLTTEGGVDFGFTVRRTVVQIGSTLRLRDGTANHAVLSLAADRSWPLAGNRSLTVRLMLDRSVHRGEQVPYYFLPRLDTRLAPGWNRFRFYGNDRLVLGATYVHPIFEILKSHAFEAVINLGLSQVYEDIANDFSPRVAVAPDRASFRGNVPLEPTLGLGSRLVSRQSGEELASVIIGFSAEGIQIGSLKITQRLSDWFPGLR